MFHRITISGLDGQDQQCRYTEDGAPVAQKGPLLPWSISRVMLPCPSHEPKLMRYVSVAEDRAEVKGAF